MNGAFRALLKTGSGSLASMLFGIISVKVIAGRLGPDALGAFSLTRQIILVGSALFLTGGQTAVVQALASRSGRDRAEVASTAFIMLTCGSMFVSLVFLVAGASLLRTFLGPLSGEFVRAVPLLAAAIAVSGPIAYQFGSLNAERKLGRLAVAQVLNAAALAILLWVNVSPRDSDMPLRLALLLVLAQIPGLMFSLWSLDRATIFPRYGFTFRAARQLTIFAAATVSAAALQSLTLFGLRTTIAKHMDLGGAGLFDAGWSISMVYLMLLLTSFSTYYLPQLASGRENDLSVINRVLRMSLVIVVPLVSCVMVLRPMILVMLYSRDFLAASAMMRGMLLGDCLKVISFVLAMPMLARADLRAFVAGEVMWGVLMYFGTRFALWRGGGLQSVGVVFALSYAAYLIYALVYCRIVLGWSVPRDLRLPIVTALIVLGAVSALTWNCMSINPVALLVSAVGAIATAFLALRHQGQADDKSKLVTEPGL